MPVLPSGCAADVQRLPIRNAHGDNQKPRLYYRGLNNHLYYFEIPHYIYSIMGRKTPHMILIIKARTIVSLTLKSRKRLNPRRAEMLTAFV